MRLIGFVAAATVGSALSLDIRPAAAFDAYRWVCGGNTPAWQCDPYAYEYRQPRYYPYFNSRQWKPAWAYRPPEYNHALPPYQGAWGYPDAYQGSEWDLW
jgi:hypothetical protein